MNAGFLAGSVLIFCTYFLATAVSTVQEEAELLVYFPTSQAELLPEGLRANSMSPALGSTPASQGLFTKTPVPAMLGFKVLTNLMSFWLFFGWWLLGLLFFLWLPCSILIFKTSLISDHFLIHYTNGLHWLTPLFSWLRTHDANIEPSRNWLQGGLKRWKKSLLLGWEFGGYRK